MSRGFQISLLLVAILSVVSGCGDDQPTGCCREAAFTFEWRVTNDTGDSLEVFARIAGSLRHAVLGELDTQILLRRTFGFAPASARDVECISVYTMDGELRFQQSPAVVERWNRVDTGPNETLLTLAVEINDLAQQPIEDECMLRGASLKMTNADAPNSALHALVAAVGRR